MRRVLMISLILCGSALAGDDSKLHLPHQVIMDSQYMACGSDGFVYALKGYKTILNKTDSVMTFSKIEDSQELCKMMVKMAPFKVPTLDEEE